MEHSEAFNEGIRLYRSGEFAAAIQALALLSGGEDAAGRLARYYMAMAHRALGIECVQAERFGPAANHLRQAVALIGNRADLAEYLFIIYARTRQYEQAAAEADVLAAASTDDTTAHVRLAQAQWRNGQRPLAIMTLTAALRRLGDRADLHLDLGLLHAAEERYDQACRHLARSVECDCTSARAYRCLGLAEAARGRPYEAAGAFARACALEPRDVLSAYQLCLAAEACRAAGRTLKVALTEARQPPAASVIRQLAEYAATEPDFVEAFLALPPSAADEELFGVVVAILRTALAAHPGYADLHYLASAALTRLGDTEAARVHAGRAVEINGRYVKALVHLAELDRRAGDRPAAVGHLRQAVAAGGDWPDLHARLADLLRDTGAADEARRHYQRALRLNGHYQPAAEGLRALAA